MRIKTAEIKGMIDALDREARYVNTSIIKMVDADWGGEPSDEELDLCRRADHIEIARDELDEMLNDAVELETFERLEEAFARGGLKAYNEAKGHGVDGSES